MTDPASYRPEPRSIPTRPGVYRFRDPRGKVIYVGKARSLRSRLNSYFQDPQALHPRTRAMVTTAASVDWSVVRSDVEALVLEHSWIKEYDPQFNVAFKDDKSYPFLAITWDEDVPRIIVTRSARRKGTRYFGPYAKVWAIRRTVDTLLTALPMRSCSTAVFSQAQRSGKPCLLAHLEKCSAPCVGRVSQEQHRETVLKVCAVLGGDAKPLARELTEAMETASREERFEAAAKARDRLNALTTVMELNAVVLDPGVSCDVIGLADDEYEFGAHVFHVRDGRILGERAWIIDKPTPLDPGEIVSLLLQEAYSGPAAPEVPPEILVPAAPPPAVREWLTGIRGSVVDVRVPARGSKAELAETSRANAVEALARHRLKRATDLTARSAALRELQEALGLSDAPLRIECYDISHMGGKNQVASMVVFEDALPRNKQYRQFTIDDARDDTAAMHEVITRRFSRYLKEAALPLEERERSRFAYPPQLVVVDGGEPQVAAATRALKELGIDIAVCGLAKRMEEVWLPHRPFPAVLPRGSQALFLLQRVRDEAHRFAIGKHRAKRSKVMTASALDQIPGVGATRARALLRHFGSVERLRQASLEQISLVAGIGDDTAGSVFSALHPEDGMLEP
ncbi:MAG: excinuclease ABC subunit UvrC [Demequinaceae bacterium]|nr:excinuclease ABC subunit UvrC [Demequinaceae bacterium]